MEPQLIGKNVEITAAIRDYVDKKVNRLVRHLPQADEVKIELHDENARASDQRFTAQITIKSKGSLLRSEERGSNVNSAIDAVTDVLEHRIDRYKDKLHKRNRGASLAKNSSAWEVAVGDNVEVYPKVVRIKNFEVKVMSAEEATEQMELLNRATRPSLRGLNT